MSLKNCSCTLSSISFEMKKRLLTIFKSLELFLPALSADKTKIEAMSGLRSKKKDWACLESAEFLPPETTLSKSKSWKTFERIALSLSSTEDAERELIVRLFSSAVRRASLLWNQLLKNVTAPRAKTTTIPMMRASVTPIGRLTRTDVSVSFFFFSSSVINFFHAPTAPYVIRGGRLTLSFCR